MKKALTHISVKLATHDVVVVVSKWRGIYHAYKIGCQEKSSAILLLYQFFLSKLENNLYNIVNNSTLKPTNLKIKIIIRNE